MLLKLYHGTGNLFDQFDAKRARIANDNYGGGIAYLTDSKALAKSYAKSMSKKTGNQYILEVDFNSSKMFDINGTFTDKKLTPFVSGSGEMFARHAGLLSYGVDKYLLLSDLKAGRMNLTGEQIFKGISEGNTTKGKKFLENMGYDSLKYTMKVGVMHNVYIAYDGNKLKITRVEKLD